MTRICVFCASSIGNRPVYLEAATRLGQTLAERGIGVVYGGASVGMMGAVADGALAAGGEVIGVIPRQLVDREVAHAGLTEQHIVETMHQRKARMVELSDAFVALPGGFGTLDELFEGLTWSQLGIHHKPIGLWNVDGYWTALIAALDHMASEGLLRAHDRARLTSSADLDALLEVLLA